MLDLSTESLSSPHLLRQVPPQPKLISSGQCLLLLGLFPEEKAENLPQHHYTSLCLVIMGKVNMKWVLIFAVCQTEVN